MTFYRTRTPNYFRGPYRGKGRRPKPVDPHLDDVVLFLKFDGPDASTTFTDSSPLANTVTGFGDAQLSTANKKYGTASLLLDGAGDYLSTSNGTEFDFLNNDWTFEAWIKSTGTGHYCIMSGFTTGSEASRKLNIRMDANLIYVDNGLTVPPGVSPTISVSLTDFVHVAVVTYFDSVTYKTKVFVDGVEDYEFTSQDYTGLTILRTGFFIASTPLYYFGNIDTLRVTNGTARYLANFNPETDTFLNV